MCAFLIAVVFLIVEWRYRFSGLSVVLFPLVFGMTLVAAMERAPGPGANEPMGQIWLGVHILLVLAGYAALSLTAVAAFAYLIQERRLKRKQTSSLLERLPPLATLDNLISKSLGLGFAFLTLGLVFGIMWAVIYSPDTSWIGDARIALSLVTWALLLVMMILRASAGWRGRKAAVMALAVLGCSALTWAAHAGLRSHSVPMKLLLTGLNHRTAPVEVRERLAFEDKSLPQALDDLKRRPGLLEGMILSTCNRVEVAVTADEQADVESAVEDFLADSRHVERAWVTPYLYRFDGPEAIRHLFRVASSLDSMVVGEPQILGQLKSAYALAKEHGAVGGFLDQVMTGRSASPSACARRPTSERARSR